MSLLYIDVDCVERDSGALRKAGYVVDGFRTPESANGQLQDLEKYVLLIAEPRRTRIDLRENTTIKLIRRFREETQRPVIIASLLDLLELEKLGLFLRKDYDFAFKKPFHLNDLRLMVDSIVGKTR